MAFKRLYNQFTHKHAACMQKLIHKSPIIFCT